MKSLAKTSLQHTFLITQILMGLILGFLAVEGVVLWRVCHEGTKEVQSLKKEGLPSLRNLAALQENLVVFQLRSYELMFVPEQDRSNKISQADALQTQNQALLENLKKIFPSGDGQQLVTTLDGALSEYVQTTKSLRAKLDKDFQEAMKVLDSEIPGKIARLNDSATKLKGFCEKFADNRTESSVGAFDHIQSSTMVFGCVGLGLGMLATLLVSVSSLRIRRALEAITSRLGQSSLQVDSSAEFVASASQTFASSTSEQAASLEETSSSLEEMSSVTHRNAESAQKANTLAQQARAAADTGAAEMTAMNAAMEAIKVSSDDIAKIIKTIDEIAFQTNILALNAAVEAARAGEAGMGFAVVAEEVRNLAQRCAQSARETASKIEGAISKTAQGVQISAKVTLGLQEIVTKVRQVDELVAEVTTASKEQSQGITQINQAISQMDQITQQNAASAEECASASQELSSQADVVKTAVAELLEIIKGAGDEAQAHHSTSAVDSITTAPARARAQRPARLSSHASGATKHALSQPTPASVSREIPLDDADFQ